MKKKGKNFFANKNLPISPNQMVNVGSEVVTVATNGRNIHNENDKQTSKHLNYKYFGSLLTS
jgi:hypothetical protein